MFRDLSWILPAVALAVLACGSGSARAAQSILEVAPEFGSGAVAQKLPREAGVTDRGLGTAANDSDDDDDDDDQPASSSSLVPGNNAHASVSTASDGKSSNSVRREGADDDDEDFDDDGPAVHDNQPASETRIDRYRDSDHNDTLGSTSIASAPVGDYSVTVRNQSVRASDPLGAERAEESVITIHRDLSESFGLSGGLGSYRTNLNSGFAGSAEAKWERSDWSISASVVRDLVLKTAQAIRSNIRQTDFGVSASYDLATHVTSDFEFHHKLYSDGNSSNELTFSPMYEFALRKSQLDLGYSFNYQAFGFAADHGYYDPHRLISNGLTGTWKFDRERYYGNVEASEGYADIKGASGDLGAGTSAICTEVIATLGLRPAKDTLIEAYLSGERAAAWSSNSLGVRIRYSF